MKIVLLLSFYDGFWFGLGFLFALFVFFFFLIIVLGKYLKGRKEKKLQKKLSLPLLEKYLSKLSAGNQFTEAAAIRDYIAAFKDNKPMNDFFQKYQICTKLKFTEEKESDDEDGGDSIFGGKFDRVYYIKKRDFR